MRWQFQGNSRSRLFPGSIFCESVTIFHITMTNSRFYGVLTAVLPLFVLAPFAGAQVPQAPTHPIVLHAARLLEIESGKIVSPGEVS